MNLKFWSIALELLRAALSAVENLVRDKQPTTTTFTQGLVECRDRLNRLVPQADQLNQDKDRGATPSEETFVSQENDRNSTGAENSSGE